MIFLVSLGRIGAQAWSIFSSWLTWIIIIIGMLLFMFLFLKIKKRRKFVYPALIQYDLGNGKIGIEKKKAGWFRTKKAFFGLFDYAGERRLETNDKRVIQQGSTQDFHEINHKRGLIVYAKSDDPKVLLPIKRMKVENSELIESIAPADFRDTSAKILAEAQKETNNSWEKIAQYAALGILAIVVLVCIILVIQFSNRHMTEANEMLNEVMDKKAELIDNINIQTTPSVTAP